MSVQNEPLDDMACVVKCETPPEWRWKFCEFQHGKRYQNRKLNNIGWRGWVTLSTALNLVHQNSFPKLANFPSYFTKLYNFPGGPLSKACRSQEKETKQSDITCKQLEPGRTISKIQKRKEFVRALCYIQCPKNSFKRLYIVKGLLGLVDKTWFLKEIRWEFQCGGEGNLGTRSLFCYSDLLVTIGSFLEHSRNPKYCWYKNSNQETIKCLILILLAFITGNNSLEPLLEGLFAQIHIDLSWRGFGRNRTGDLRITQLC